jgi:hypothetical protein
MNKTKDLKLLYLFNIKSSLELEFMEQILMEL